MPRKGFGLVKLLIIYKGVQMNTQEIKEQLKDIFRAVINNGKEMNVIEEINVNNNKEQEMALLEDLKRLI